VEEITTPPPQPEPVKVPETPISVRPVSFIKLPGRTKIIERMFVHTPLQGSEGERHTGPLVVPPAHVTVNVEPPERSTTDDRRESSRDIARPEKERGTGPKDTPPTGAAEIAPVENPEKEYRYIAPSDRGKPVEIAQPEAENNKEKFNEKPNTPLNFSPAKPASEAAPKPKLKHVARTRGRQRKYHQTIALLEDYHDGEVDQFARLDDQMQRYYRREYPEYFGRDSKAKANKRLANRTKASRTKRESERRRIVEISRTVQGVSHH
jgi:hypothetical protein